jgi:hypothetical protein
VRATLRGVTILAVILLAGACSGAVRTAAPAESGPGPAASSGATRGAPSALPGPDAWLVVGRKGVVGLEVVLASTLEKDYDLPMGVPSERWGSLITATLEGDRTVVRDLIVQPGFHVSQKIAVDGAWRLPTFASDPLPTGVSLDRNTVVLVEDDAAQTADRTRLAVLEASLSQPARILDIPGTFTYDAISPDGRTIYVIEHLAGPPDGHYQVRAIDVGSGNLKPGVIVDKLKIGEQMAGRPVAQLRRDDGGVLTLYRGAEHPFIHALYTADGYADCIDLPATETDYTDAALDWGLAPARGGNAYAVNTTLGVVLEVRPADRAIARSARLTPARSAAITLAKFGHIDAGPVGRRVVVSPDGRTIYAAGAGGIVAIGTDQLTETGRFLAGQAVDALGLTPDGSMLYALVRQGGRIVKIGVVAGRILGDVPSGGFDRLVGVVPW